MKYELVGYIPISILEIFLYSLLKSMHLFNKIYPLIYFVTASFNLLLSIWYLNKINNSYYNDLKFIEEKLHENNIEPFCFAI